MDNFYRIIILKVPFLLKETNMTHVSLKVREGLKAQFYLSIHNEVIPKNSVTPTFASGQMSN